jgi:hypothetical protein
MYSESVLQDHIHAKMKNKGHQRVNGSFDTVGSLNYTPSPEGQHTQQTSVETISLLYQ